MKNAFFFTILTLVSFSSCAEPRYEKNPGAFPTEGAPSSKVASCELKFQKSGLCVLWQWEKRPTASEVGTLIFKVVRGNELDDSPLPVDLPSVPEVVLWMPSMGHGSSPTKVEKVDTGSYRATQVFFVMPGDWEIWFQIKEGNTVQDEAVLSLII